MVPPGEEKNPNKQVINLTREDTHSNTEPLWTAEDVATYLRLEPETVRTMTRNGDLPGFKVGRMWRYRHKDIKTWLKQTSQ